MRKKAKTIKNKKNRNKQLVTNLTFSDDKE